MARLTTGMVTIETKADNATPPAAHFVLPPYSSVARKTILLAGIASIRIKSVRMAESKGSSRMSNVQEMGTISIFSSRKP